MKTYVVLFSNGESITFKEASLSDLSTKLMIMGRNEDDVISITIIN
jgi:hypothetical protein